MKSRNVRLGRIAWLLLLPAVLVIVAAAQGPGGPGRRNAGPPDNGFCPMWQQGNPASAQRMGPQRMYPQMSRMRQTSPMHQEMSRLIDQVASSAAALEKETNLTALKQKVTEHAALVKQLRDLFQQNTQRMRQAGPAWSGCPGFSRGAPSK